MEWKLIPGYEDYMASTDGQIMSLKNNIIMKQINHHRGYFVVKVSNKMFMTHQLIAMTFLGHTPNKNTMVVDHINSNKLDNRVENLRVVSNRENTSKISEKKKNNTSSKYIGVTWDKTNKKWVSQIHINGKRIRAYHKTEEEAHIAYQNELKRLCKI